MNRIWVSAVLFIVASLVAGACQPAAPAVQVPGTLKTSVELPDLGGREVSLAIEKNHPPYDFLHNTSSESGGWIYDTWAEVCKRLNCKPIFTKAASADVIQAVAEMHFDAAIGSIGGSSQHADVVDFSIGPIKTEQRLLIRKGENRFESLEDIANDDLLRLGTQVGSAQYQHAIEYLPEERVKTYENMPLAIQALIDGGVDAIIVDIYNGIGYFGKNEEEVELAGPPIASDDLAFIFRKGSELRDPVNAALQSMIDDGTLEKLNEKYIASAFGLAETAGEILPTEIIQPQGSERAAFLPDLKGRKVTIAVEKAYLPFNYVDEKTGKAIGWDYETWDEICKRLDCKPIYKVTSWSGLIQAVADKQYDTAADGIIHTESREQIVDFSIGYIKTEHRLLVRKGENRFKSMEDFANDSSLYLGGQAETIQYENAIRYLSDERIKTYKHITLAIDALIAGEIDAVIIEVYDGIGYLGNNQEEVELIEQPVISHELGFIFPKESDLIAPVNAAIQSMIDDGTLKKINEKYFGSDFTFPVME